MKAIKKRDIKLFILFLRISEKLRRCMRDRPCTSNSYQTECDYSTSDVPTPQDVSALRDHIVRHQKLSPRAHGYLAELECYADLGGHSDGGSC